MTGVASHAGIASLVCAPSLTSLDGVNVAIDNEYEVIVEGRRAGYLRMSGSWLEAAVTGLAIHHGLASPGDYAVIDSVEERAPMSFVLRAKLERRTATLPPREYRVEWRMVESLYKRFITMVSKRNCPYALHIIAVYELNGEEHPVVLVSDASRHAAAYKAAGLLSKMLGEVGLGPLAAVTTGRVSSDIVDVLSSVGVYMVVANHHPLLSGLVSAAKHGVTLVLRDPSGAGLAVYTGHSRVRGAPRRIELSVHREVARLRSAPC